MILAYIMNAFTVPLVTVRLVQKSIKTRNTPAIINGMMISREILEQILQSEDTKNGA